MSDKEKEFSLPEPDQEVMLEDQPRTLSFVPRKDWDFQTVKENTVYLTGDLIIDCYARIIYKNGKMLNLGKTEYDLILFLVQNNTLFITRRVLLDLAEQRYQHHLVDNTLSKHIHRVRQKLGQNASHQYVKTRNSSGYKWAMPVRQGYVSR